MSNPVRDDCEAHVVRPWRIALVLYAIALTIGTHWPKLELRLVDMPAPDKILHMLGFGGLVFLLWRARWWGLGRGGWFLAIVTMLWAVIDEATQAIPMLGRSFSWMDVVGGWLGISLVLVWIWAIKPVGGPASHERYAMNERIVDALFLRPMTWLLVVAAGLIAAAALGVPMAVHVHGIDHSAALAGFAATGVPGGSVAAVTVLAMLWRRRRTELGVQPLPRSAWNEAIWHASATFIGGISLLAAMYACAYEAGWHASWAMILLDTPTGTAKARIPADLRLAIDLALLGVVLAVSVRIARETLARAVCSATIEQ